MARPPVVTKTDVRNARATLIKRDGQEPSTDAILEITGGSKSTVLKYLQQLRREDGGKAGLSQAVQDLVAQLADQVYAEAQEEAKELRREMAEKDARHAAALAGARQDIASLEARLQASEAAHQVETEAHARTREILHQEEIARRTAEQHAAGLQERLADRDRHVDTLNQNLRDARAALEHYRSSVQEQREQDERRRQQRESELNQEISRLRQDAVARQTDVTRLNREGAELAAQVGAARKELQDALDTVRAQEQQIEEWRRVEQRAAMLEAQLGERGMQTQILQEQLAAASDKAEVLAARLHELELALAQSQTKVDVQQGIAAELRAYLDSRERVTASDQGLTAAGENNLIKSKD